MNQSIYPNKKSAVIRLIRVIRVPLASIRLCAVAAFLLLSLTVSAGYDSLFEIPDQVRDDSREDLYLVPRHSFGEEQNLTPLDVESLTETIDMIYNQEENILRAGGTEGDGGDPTKMPVGSATGVILGLSALYALRRRKQLKASLADN